MITTQNKAPKLAKAIGLNTELYLKREDLHPYGSHKGRSIPIMIKYYAKQGWCNFVISSSGNAGLAAAHAVKDYNKKHSQKKLTLTVFVGKKIDKKKYQGILRLRSIASLRRGVYTERSECAQDDKNIKIKKVANPKQQAFQLDKACKAKNLRQSTDDLALLGYYELARELSKIKNLSAVFIPTSSGTTAQGLYEGFKKLELKPQIHIVQTNFCHPMIINQQSEISNLKSEISLANAIVDKVAHRKEKILKILKNSHGAGWVANNKETKEMIKLIKKEENINISANSALSIVGLRQAVEKQWKFNSAVACLITGQ